MTTLEFADLLNGLPDHMLVAAVKPKKAFITKNKIMHIAAAAACFSVILGGVLAMLHFGKQPDEHLILTQSNVEDVTEIAWQTQVTSESAVSTSSETTASAKTQQHTETFSSTSVTGFDTGQKFEMSQEATTDDSARMVTYPKITASETTAAASSAAKTTTAATSLTETIRCQPYGDFTLPESLCDTIEDTLGTTEFCYYMDAPLPVGKSWQKAEIPIITKEHTYVLMYLVTDQANEVSMYTNIQRRTFTVTSERPVESELNRIAARYGGDLRGGYSASKGVYEYFFSDLNITQSGVSTEIELQKLRSEWAWQVAPELQTIPDINVRFETEYLNGWSDFVTLQ